MSAKTILVTGSTNGIGRQIAQKLARKGAEVLLHGRDPSKGQSVMDEIRRVTGSDRLQFFQADLASRQQVHSLAEEINESYDRLHVLINNAGTYQPERRLTEDGLETTFAVNYLAPFLLVRELLPLLKKSAPSRIICVASIAHWNAQVNWNNLQGEMHYDAFDAYALSKLCIILFTYTLAERLKGTGVTANCLHPGVIKTKLLQAGFGDHPGDTPEKGAETSVYLACSSEVKDVTGRYFEKCKPVRSSPLSYDRELQEMLWRVSEKLTGRA
jgi:NAD(P)-dependent dehydrogenase (short-subunit alcohol dehydrogenase family)